MEQEVDELRNLNVVDGNLVFVLRYWSHSEVSNRVPTTSVIPFVGQRCRDFLGAKPSGMLRKCDNAASEH